MFIFNTKHLISFTSLQFLVISTFFNVINAGVHEETNAGTYNIVIQNPTHQYGIATYNCPGAHYVPENTLNTGALINTINLNDVASIIAKYASVAAPSPLAQQYSPVYKINVPEPTHSPNYQYGYAVNDPYTGDVKSQTEERIGDQVKGSYSVVDADGSKRTVEYTADAINGFNAVVRKEPATLNVKDISTVPVESISNYQLVPDIQVLSSDSYKTPLYH